MMPLPTRLLPFASFLLVSCVSDIAQFPSDWPEIAKTENARCIDLSGTYLNKGIGASTNKYRSEVRLSSLLLLYIPGREYSDHQRVDTVELKGVENGMLEIIFWEKKERFFQTRLGNENDFKCMSEFLLMSNSQGEITSMSIGVRSHNTKIARGTDGSILASDERKGAGLAFFLIPGGERKLLWYRFLPASP